ncbi:MAG: hypothetical protein KY459_12295 [Acidobacteria bacterium]|nr:hypothetical protein [Acidobacteriota bacterium]
MPRRPSKRCAAVCSRTRSSKTTNGRSRIERLLAALSCSIFLAVSFPAFASTPLELLRSRSKSVVKRWALPGSPRGLALASDGTLYAGLAARQSVVRIDPDRGEILSELVLDDPDIAATKDLVSVRIDEPRSRLIIANGSDESVTIVSIPRLAIEREITLEGEMIRDAIPDPAGRFIYILGRDVHVFDGEGGVAVRAIAEPEPMAIAVSADGAMFAVIGAEQFPSGEATVAALWSTSPLREIRRVPLQTDRKITAALFAAGDASLVVTADDWLAQVPLAEPSASSLDTTGEMPRVSLAFGQLTSSQKICLADPSGPQVLAPGRTDREVVFAEHRCGESGSFTGSVRHVEPLSLYNVKAWAVVWDVQRNGVFATNPEGELALYRAPGSR